MSCHCFTMQGGLIVQVNDLDRQMVLRTGRQLLDIHLDTALTRHADDFRLRIMQLDAHGRREPEPHGPQPTGIDPAVRLVKG